MSGQEVQKEVKVCLLCNCGRLTWSWCTRIAAREESSPWAAKRRCQRMSLFVSGEGKSRRRPRSSRAPMCMVTWWRHDESNAHQTPHPCGPRLHHLSPRILHPLSRWVHRTVPALTTSSGFLWCQHGEHEARTAIHCYFWETQMKLFLIPKYFPLRSTPYKTKRQLLIVLLPWECATCRL